MKKQKSILWLENVNKKYRTESLNDLAPKAENPIDVNSEANEA